MDSLFRFLELDASCAKCQKYTSKPAIGPGVEVEVALQEIDQTTLSGPRAENETPQIDVYYLLE